MSHILDKYPELAEIVQLWPGLPEHICQAIKTQVKSHQVKENSKGASFGKANQQD